MKIAGIILAVLMLTGSALVGVIGSNKAMDLGKDVAKITDGLSDAQMAEAGIPSPGRLKFGGIVGILGAVFAVGLMVVTFIKRDKIPLVAIAAGALALVAIVLYPAIETGANDGMAPRTQAIVAGVMLVLGAGGAFLAKRSASKA